MFNGRVENQERNEHVSIQAPTSTVGEDGVWSQVLNRVCGPGRRAALFLDRDGVLVDEVHYLCRPEDARLSIAAVDVIGRANGLSVPVVIITNQAGIGHGKYGWDEFAAVQEKIADDLASGGTFFNAVYACPHHADGKPPYNTPDHPYRKPNPGMLLRAAEEMPIDLAQSWIVGDRASDMEAGLKAGLAGGLHLLTGHGSDDSERAAAAALATAEFQVLIGETLIDAIDLALLS